MILGIDASRSKSWGAVRHIIGVLESVNDINEFGIEQIHIWAPKETLDLLPELPFLIKHSPASLRQSLLQQLLWQKFCLPKALRINKCGVLFSTDAGTLCSFSPNVILSQDILPFEREQVRRMGFGYAGFRVRTLFYVQRQSIRRSAATVFLSLYAKERIAEFTPLPEHVAIVPHGIDRDFIEPVEWKLSTLAPTPRKSVNIIYVSSLEPYKNHETVINAIKRVHGRGVDVSLRLIGGGTNNDVKRVNSAIKKADRKNEYIEWIGHVDKPKLIQEIKNCDIFVFASSCESMPVTLLEGMAMGVPIICSSAGPMLEIVGPGVPIFDPKSATALEKAIMSVVNDPSYARKIRDTVKLKASEYSWKKCSYETFKFIANCVSDWEE